MALLFMAEMKSFREVFQYQLHIRIQQYLRSCTRGRISRIKVVMLDLSDIISHLDTSTWQASTPPCLRDLIKSRNYNNHKDRGGNGNNQ